MTSKFLAMNRWARWLHIYSAAPVLLLMMFFALTGVTLNHLSWNLGDTEQSSQSLELPSALLDLDWQSESSQTALSVLAWLDQEHGFNGVDIEINWELEEQLLLLHLEGPQGSYAIEVYPEDEMVDVFVRDLPFLEMLNNLHRGKHVTGFWRWLSDISGVCMLIFCLSGLWLLMVNTVQRATTLSWVSMGSVVMVLTVYLMH
ncbi:hypothetical protein MAQ5080_01502 [Marinomonas aquimarina]|uniref:PepSY-associated TM helix n=1 Tax=Marinomonas aquimarina TaxID=295068 RepID=A0A1A8TAZ5_9GAMM|nr:PepSY-associated TM helix domain-containing protein [Marinomonas aquimarina]SBS29784.1 hypothetical protein MAQ5080_01502 [Marinomonas aquimarina]